MMLNKTKRNINENGFATLNVELTPDSNNNDQQVSDESTHITSTNNNQQVSDESTHITSTNNEHSLGTAVNEIQMVNF